MAHFDTARINEMLGLQIGIIQEVARKLNADNVEQLERDLENMEGAIKEIRSTLEGVPHLHAA